MSLLELLINLHMYISKAINFLLKIVLTQTFLANNLQLKSLGSV